MLFRCNWAKAVWFTFNVRTLGDLGSNACALKWTAEMVDMMPRSEAIDFMGKVALIAWHIWKSRSNYIFRRSKIDPVATIAAINKAWFESSSILEISNVHMDTPSTQEDLSTWRAPDRDCFKANCDVAIPKGGGAGKLAVVIRNWKGEIMDGMARSVFANSSLSGELSAIRAACNMLIKSKIKGATVEADNRQAILLSVSELVPPWEVSAEVLDIRDLAREGDICFNWVRRAANKAAHEIAALARRKSLPCNWVVYPPLSLFSILCKDLAL